jgi:hypothetical protein
MKGTNMNKLTYSLFAVGLISASLSAVAANNSNQDNNTLKNSINTSAEQNNTDTSVDMDTITEINGAALGVNSTNDSKNHSKSKKHKSQGTHKNKDGTSKMNGSTMQNSSTTEDGTMDDQRIQK